MDRLSGGIGCLDEAHQLGVGHRPCWLRGVGQIHLGERVRQRHRFRLVAPGNVPGALANSHGEDGGPGSLAAILFHL
jgi:hypothetical protein